MKLGEIRFRRGLLLRQIFVGNEVAELVGIAKVTAENAEERVALELGLVAFLEQAEQPVVRRFGRGCGRRRLRALGGYRRNRKQGGRKQDGNSRRAADHR
jgi:hypothetical protein